MILRKPYHPKFLKISTLPIHSNIEKNRPTPNEQNQLYPVFKPKEQAIENSQKKH
eukprot:m.34109 g.34109  ORF g.34109 m.34109 type:complete len:55 (+) comp15385_c0_seq1:129-293(+)